MLQRQENLRGHRLMPSSDMPRIRGGRAARTQHIHAVLRVQNEEITVSLPSLQPPQPDAEPQGHQTLQKAHIYPQAQHASLKSRRAPSWRRTHPPEPAP